MAVTTIPSAGLTLGAQVNFRNIIINGDMSIAQRGTSHTTASGYTLDRWHLNDNTSGAFTVTQSTTVPSGQGFAKSYKLDCTTADASPDAGEYLIFNQRIEGQNLQYIKKGTSNAESLTLSFWVRSNKTGTYIAELRDGDNTRHNTIAYTISSADTWEKKIITFAGDTSGALDNDNARSFDVNFWLLAGSNFSSGTLTSNTWSSITDANRAVGNVNIADSTSNEWYITGVQLEVGTSASDFEFLPHDVNLQRCQRYFQVYGSTGGFQGITTGLAGSSTANWCQLTYVNSMRSSPSISFTNLVITDRTSADHTVNSIDNVHSGTVSLAMKCNTSSGFSARDAVALTAKNTGSGYLRLDSEL
jgi:hypothetical protein